MSIFKQYYQNEQQNKRMDIYAYAPPPNFSLVADGVRSPAIQDFRNVERYKEYKECGFNVLLGQTSAPYGGEAWETSAAKSVLDMAYEAGIEKVILLDDRIRELSKTEGGLIGQGKPFASEEELQTHIAALMAPYKDHPAFYGVQFKDEPRWTLFKTFGQLYRSIKKVRPSTFIQCNLLPIIILSMTDSWYPDGGDLFDRFKRYLNMFLDETGADYIMYDNYPIYHSPDGEFGRCFYRFYFKALQIAGQVCKERGVKLYFVMQSFAMLQGGKLTCKTPNEGQMFYQANAVLGFGAKQLSYYTYWSCGILNCNGEIRPDKTAIMSRMGEKMPLYYSVQKVNAMIQKLFPVISNFDYESDRYIIKTPFKSGPWHLEYTGRGELKHVEAVTDLEVALVCELKDKKTGQYMYVVENITYNDAEEALGLPKQNTTLKFAPQFTKIDIFDGENWRTEELKNGEYTATLAAGYAEYILPY